MAKPAPPLTDLGGDGRSRRRVERREGQARLAAGLADGNGHVREEAVHAVDDLLGRDLAPAVLVRRVREQREVHVRDELLEVLQRLGAHLVDEHVLRRVRAQRGSVDLEEVEELEDAAGDFLGEAVHGGDAVAVKGEDANIRVLDELLDALPGGRGGSGHDAGAPLSKRPQTAPARVHSLRLGITEGFCKAVGLEMVKRFLDPGLDKREAGLGLFRSSRRHSRLPGASRGALSALRVVESACKDYNDEVDD